MKNLLSTYRAAITSETTLPAPSDVSLEISRSGALSACYAPFEHVNINARVVLLGMTPGAQQAGNALSALRSALASGASDKDALEVAKNSASFSGPMRSNLVAMLDRIGLNKVIGLGSCADLFTTRTDLVHFTSALRYPVFVNGSNYTGSPSVLSTPYLLEMSERWLSEEVAQLPDAFWIPLGKEAKSVLSSFEAKGRLNRDRVLEGLPHPSGANAERIAYFLGRKPRDLLSAKTNPDALDAARKRLEASIANCSVASLQGDVR